LTINQVKYKPEQQEEEEVNDQSTKIDA